MSAQTVDGFQVPYAVAPGETLKETIEALGMSQADLARRSGLTTKTINHIVKGTNPITPETALAFEKVTGVRARFWNNLEANYQEALSRAAERQALEADVGLLDALPVKQLVGRGAVEDTTDRVELLRRVLAFFRVADRSSWEKAWLEPVAAFKQSDKLKAQPGAVAAWLRLGEIEADQIACADFSKPLFEKALSEIRAMTRADVDEYAPRMVKLCSNSGVALVFVPEITGARAWGAVRWADSSRAIIQLSLRYKWEDHFWFSFFHEAAHLLLHGKRETFVDSDGGGSQLEDEANRFAARMLIPGEHESDLPQLTTITQIEEFAGQIELHPGIVVGRLQREGIISWKVGNGLRRKLQFVGEDV